jgi:hypothetical protein
MNIKRLTEIEHIARNGDVYRPVQKGEAMNTKQLTEIEHITRNSDAYRFFSEFDWAEAFDKEALAQFRRDSCWALDQLIGNPRRKLLLNVLITVFETAMRTKAAFSKPRPITRQASRRNSISRNNARRKIARQAASRNSPRKKNRSASR